MRIGIMTGGGDAPGLNGIIEACVRVLVEQGAEVLGIEDGFDGVFEGRTRSLDLSVVQSRHAHAGTLLGSSNKTSTQGRQKEFQEKFKALRLDGLIACGGDGTFTSLQRVSEGLPLIGVPKTIDNDLAGTDVTFGYDTACAVVAESVDALRFTAEAHRRVLVVETMGRTAGWIALGGGLASYADAILIPERPFQRDKLYEFVRGRQAAGQRGLMIVVAEGATAVGEDPVVAFRVENSPEKDRLGGISMQLMRDIEHATGWEARHVVLGHLQRSRAPTTTDRFLTLAMGVEAARLALAQQWGRAVVYRQGQVTNAPLADLMHPARRVPPDHRWVKLAQSLGLFI